MKSKTKRDTTLLRAFPTRTVARNAEDRQTPQEWLEISIGGERPRPRELLHRQATDSRPRCEQEKAIRETERILVEC